MSFKARFNPSPSFKARFDPPDRLEADFSSFIIVPVADYYEGEYTVTPTAEQQIIPVIGKTMRQNLTVEPIPSNYGRIAWDGSVMTVS